MNIEALSTPELLSHTAELVSAQDREIERLRDQRQALAILLACVTCWILAH